MCPKKVDQYNQTEDIEKPPDGPLGDGIVIALMISFLGIILGLTALTLWGMGELAMKVMEPLPILGMAIILAMYPAMFPGFILLLLSSTM